MADVTMRLEMGEVEEALREMVRRGQDLKPAMKIIRREMREELLDNAMNGVGPDGPWAPRAPSTVAARRKGSGRAKRLLGRLPSVVQYTHDNARVTATSRARWSGAHQEGSTVGRGARLPARTFLWISDNLLQVSKRVLERFLINGWGR